MNKVKFLSMLGLARKAGKTILGSAQLRAEIQSGNKPFLCIISNTASENTKKRIINCCEYYKVKYLAVDETARELSHAVGHTGETACIGICDKGFSEAIEKIAGFTGISG